MMRILVIDVNFDQKNITYRQFYNHLSLGFDVFFWGPGYVTRDELSKGIRSFVNENGPFDAYFLGGYFVDSAQNNQDMTADAYMIHRCNIPYYNVNDAYTYCQKIIDELVHEINGIKVFIYYEDTMSMPNGAYRICEEFIRHGFYILSWPRESMRIYQTKEKKQFKYLTDNAVKLCEKYKNRYIPINMLAMTQNEIFRIAFDQKDYEWCVPGNRDLRYYPEREKLYRLIEKEQYKVWDYDPYQKVQPTTIEKKQLNWYRFRNPTEKFLSGIYGKTSLISSTIDIGYIGAARELYLESIRRTKFIFADGSIPQIVLRKHLEACACGSVLVTTDVQGLAEMGFVDGVNCRVVHKESMNDDIRYICNDTAAAKIAKNGQEFVMKKHMFANRIEDLNKTIAAILENHYHGAHYENGDYIIE